MGDGRHGFVFVTPERLKDGSSHSIRGRIVGQTAELSHSPRTLDCPASK